MKLGEQVMRERLALMRHARRRSFLPLLLLALLIVKSSMAAAACCSDAVPAPPDFPFYPSPYAGGESETRVKPGDSIQNAIDRTKPSGVVRIEAGKYEGNLVIRKPLTLVAVRSGTVRLSATNAANPCIRVKVTQGTVRIRGLVVLASSDQNAPCIDVIASDFVLSRSTVVGTPDTDAVVIRGPKSSIDGNYIARSKVGIVLRNTGAGQHFVAGNDIDDNVVALVVSGGAQLYAAQNLIHRNAGTGIVNINGGGTYSSNLVYKNGTGVQLIYSEKPVDEFADFAAQSSLNESMDDGLTYGAGASQLGSSGLPGQQDGYSSSYGAGGYIPGGFIEPSFENNVIARNVGAGVAASGGLASPSYSSGAATPLASFSYNCIYDNNTASGGSRLPQIVGEEFVTLVGKTNYIGKGISFGGSGLNSEEMRGASGSPCDGGVGGARRLGLARRLARIGLAREAEPRGGLDTVSAAPSRRQRQRLLAKDHAPIGELGRHDIGGLVGDARGLGE